MQMNSLAHGSYAGASRAAEASSTKTSQPACVWRMLEGCRFVTGPWRQSRTARAFRASGTEQTMWADFMICLIDMLIA
jgi:hypothetical protein